MLTDSQWECLAPLCWARKAPAAGTTMHISAASLTVARSNPGWFSLNEVLALARVMKEGPSLRGPAVIDRSEEKMEKKKGNVALQQISDYLEYFKYFESWKRSLYKFNLAYLIYQ